MKINKTESLHITIKLHTWGRSMIIVRRPHYKRVMLFTTFSTANNLIESLNIRKMTYRKGWQYTGNVIVPSNMIAACPIKGLFN